MKNTILFILLVAVLGCTKTATVISHSPDVTFERNFAETERLFVEIHNTKKHCIVRIWNPDKNENTPQAIFRGTAGNNTCRIYNIVNPDINPNEVDR